jgi:hypothetical protein
MRRLLIGVSAMSAVLCGMAIGGGTGAAGATPAPIMLLVPQGTAQSVIHYDCGGIGEHVYATGFDSTFDALAGYPTGDAYVWTTCNGSGKGGHSITYSAWISATWDPSGLLQTYAVLASAPTPNASFTATDSASGNALYNTTNFNCTAQTGAVPSACLLWAGTFTPRPRVFSLTTSIGAAKGGESVSISGDALDAATQVYFGTLPATSFTINSDASITAVAPPASPGTVHVTVVSPGGTSVSSTADQFTFFGQPAIAKISPNRGPIQGGYYVTMTGNHFVGTTQVLAGDTVTAFQVVSDTSMQVYIPGGDGGIGDSIDFSVTSPGGTSPSSNVQFTYTGPPSLSLSPAKGVPSAKVRAAGSNFWSGESVTVVYMTGKANPVSVTFCTAKANANGAFSCSGKIPGKRTAGAKGVHALVATGKTGDSSSASFKLT